MKFILPLFCGLLALTSCQSEEDKKKAEIEANRKASFEKIKEAREKRNSAPKPKSEDKDFSQGFMKK